MQPPFYNPGHCCSYERIVSTIRTEAIHPTVVSPPYLLTRPNPLFSSLVSLPITPQASIPDNIASLHKERGQMIRKRRIRFPGSVQRHSKLTTGGGGGEAAGEQRALSPCVLVWQPCPSVARATPDLPSSPI